jgi:hypothetical protein
MKQVAIFLLKIIICLIVAIGLAAGSVWLTMRPNNYGGQLKIGEWVTDLSTGTENAGLYQRAQVALYGLWAMSSAETVYFVANVDNQGNKLDARCTYRIEGSDPDARWWSLTAYRNFRLIPNEAKVYSFSPTTVERESDQSWQIFVAPTKQPKNWLPSGTESGDLKFLFRAYNPSSAMIRQISQTNLPTVFKENCQ